MVRGLVQGRALEDVAAAIAVTVRLSTSVSGVPRSRSENASRPKTSPQRISVWDIIVP